jgi:prolyl 4-hydroxylase
MDTEYDYEKCTGLKVKPRKDDGLLFYSLMINSTIDPVSSGLIPNQNVY